MTEREKLIYAAAKALRDLWPEDGSIVQVCDFLESEADTLATAALTALEASGVRLVPVEAKTDEERIEVIAERLRKAAQDWAREMVNKPPYWQALAAAVVPTNQETRND